MNMLHNALNVSSARHVLLVRRFLDALLPVLAGRGIEQIVVLAANEGEIPEVAGA